ncbi:MAG: hypothetical protein DI564_08470 [Rhodanobacter denitrificans]|uniref:Thioesterase domain-containing protein n=1 Tax=Rhodanobacter denitrificans TaxID=666685 RepID=A0A2W5KHV8_9GAMM|nr:MAG: hypothetical protein DI564_08470 [Rhodanobacter denitrificans]
MTFSELPLLATAAELQHLVSHEAAFTRAYGFVVVRAAPGLCELEVPHLPHFERPGGIASGQVLMNAADVAMWLAIKTVRGLDDPSVTGHMQTQFLRSVRCEAFRCEARLISLARRTAYGEARCLDLRGGLLAHHTLTFVMPAPIES